MAQDVAKDLSAQRAADGERRRETRRARRLSAGPPDLDVAALPAEMRSTVGRLVDEVDRLSGDLERERRRVRELQSMVDEDPLVPVLNRRGFMRELNRAIAFCRRYGTGAALVFLDLDDFKAVNDARGHGAGDAVLTAVAEALRANVRASDIVGRLGGDEFALVLWQAAAEDAARKAAALSAAIRELRIPCNGGALSVGASAGVATLSPEDTAETALRRADEAMYAMKRSRPGG